MDSQDEEDALSNRRLGMEEDTQMSWEEIDDVQAQSQARAQLRHSKDSTSRRRRTTTTTSAAADLKSDAADVCCQDPGEELENRCVRLALIYGLSDIQ